MKQKSLFFAFSLITSFCTNNAQDIILQNSTKEIMEQSETPAVAPVPVSDTQTESLNTYYSSTNDDEKTVFFGVDLGIGSNSHWGVISKGAVYNVNIRILWNFCPCFPQCSTLKIFLDNLV